MAHAPICAVKFCPDKTVARLTDGQRRRDLCKRHTLIALDNYRNEENVKIIEAWGGYTIEDFEKVIKEFENK